MVSKPMKKYITGILVIAVLSGAFPSVSAAFDNPKAKIPPRAHRHRRSGGESLPPLPLPATPLRRTERKREPAPPALIGMITFRGSRFVFRRGRRVRVEQFPTTQIDIERLTNYANYRLGIRYRYIETTFENFSWNPAELPLLYITGWTPLPKLPDEIIARLRRYVYDGGTIVIHAQCGRSEFIRSARREIARIFPNRRLAPIDTDSPLFRSYFRINEMRVRKNDEPFKSIPPYLEAIYVGCRPAIILSPIDLNCGWDVVRHPIEGGILYHQDDALALGVNIITCALANLKYARSFAVEKIYYQQQQKTRDQLVIGQIIHNGDWDPTPHGLPNLMKYVSANTTLNVQFKRDPVSLTDENAFEHPILYMTGLRDFKLTQVEIVHLRNYLANGGVLIADAAAGRKAFDIAFRRELHKVLPDAKLKPIELANPIFQTPFKITSVEYTEPVKALHPDLNKPILLGITIDGSLAVIYSPFSLGNGWEQIPFDYNLGYSDEDALRLGVNILTYAISH